MEEIVDEFENAIQSWYAGNLVSYKNEVKSIKKKIKSRIKELKDENNRLEKRMENSDFSWALRMLKQGKAVRLPHWRTDVKIKAQFPNENSKMTAPYLYVESRHGRVPWKETMIELFAEEWEVVE